MTSLVGNNVDVQNPIRWIAHDMLSRAPRERLPKKAGGRPILPQKVEGKTAGPGSGPAEIEIPGSIVANRAHCVLATLV